VPIKGERCQERRPSCEPQGPGRERQPGGQQRRRRGQRGNNGDHPRAVGATDPAKAEPGTIRKLYAKSLQENAVHGSDAVETARFEIGWFFPGHDLA